MQESAETIIAEGRMDEQRGWRGREWRLDFKRILGGGPAGPLERRLLGKS